MGHWPASLNASARRHGWPEETEWFFVSFTRAGTVFIECAATSHDLITDEMRDGPGVYEEVLPDKLYIRRVPAQSNYGFDIVFHYTLMEGVL